MIHLISDLLLILGALAITTLCGLPLVWRSRLRLVTVISLSFAAGFVIISSAGILGALFGIGPAAMQAVAALASASACAVSLARHEEMPILQARVDRGDSLVLCSGLIYLLICILFFDRIAMWMGGDAVAHSEMIRMLIDGQSLPVSLPQMGSYWEYYPKGFHYYAYPFAAMSSVLDSVQAIPALLTAITVVLLYSIVREIGSCGEGVYASLISCLLFPAHYSYLIWGGFPSAAAEMLLVASLLAALTRTYLLPLMLLGVLISHARVLALALGVLFCWMASERIGRRAAVALATLAAVLVLAFAAHGVMHPPAYLLSILSSRANASDFVARWYPALLSIFGAAISIARRGRLDRLALAWACAVLAIVFLADSGPLEFVGSADRLLLGVYLPLSILSATALYRMDGADGRLRRAFVLMLLLLGSSSMAVVLYSYAGSWALPEDDYEAIAWLGEQNLTDAVCINIDETGAWVYPMTGIRVCRPRMAALGFSYDLPARIARDPGEPALLDELRSIGQQNVLVYVSSVSIERPGLVPPFVEHVGAYPGVNLSYPAEEYELLYERGARIYRVRPL